MRTSFTERRSTLRREFAAAELDSLLLTDAANVYYLTGFTGEAGAVLLSSAGCMLVTDGRFKVQARQETSGIGVVLQKGAPLSSVGEILRAAGKQSVGFDPNRLTVAQLRTLRKTSGARCRWRATPGLTEHLRARKDAREIAQMREAAILAGKVLERAIRLLKPGVREFEIAGEIEYQMRKGGASGPSFETIVAFGERAALPHARPTAKRLRKNELVVLDLGVILGHYCSDITRTVFVGRAPKRIRGWYRAVLEAQSAAISAVKAGAACRDVDAAARGVLASYRLHGHFVHSTGHGLGLEVHEDPRIARGQRRRLEPNNVVTIEPGVYFAGVGGIRIEDDVVVHADGSEVITRVPRDLIEL
jgi:Xaa-Pro aminopeptidase